MPGHPSEELMQSANKTAPKACSADEIRLSIPASQPLPAAFQEYFGDVGDFEGLGRQQRQGLTA